jgi:hypothetical protein
MVKTSSDFARVVGRQITRYNFALHEEQSFQRVSWEKKQKNKKCDRSLCTLKYLAMSFTIIAPVSASASCGPLLR